MSPRAQLSPILENERLTRGLEDAEARMLIEWLVARAEALFAEEGCEERAQREVARMCQRARAVGRFVSLWCYERSPCSALQLAATERFAWPLPVNAMDACDLMHDILAWEQSGRDS